MSLCDQPGKRCRARQKSEAADEQGRFTGEKIIEILKLHIADGTTGERCRWHEISETNLYNCKAKYRGDYGVRGPASEETRGRETQLKKLLAEAMLNNAALKDIASGNF